MLHIYTIDLDAFTRKHQHDDVPEALKIHLVIHRHCGYVDRMHEDNEH